MTGEHIGRLLITAAALAVAACGGAGTQIASTPPPPPTPTPTPTPPPGPIPPAHLGLVSDQPFAVLAVGTDYKTDATGNPTTIVSGPALQDVHFNYDSATNTYGVTLPGFNAGTLTIIAYNGGSGEPATSSTSQLREGSFGFLVPAFVTLPVPGTSHSPLTYTSLGYWNSETEKLSNGDALRSDGIFAYGIPTQSGDVPITGSATYSASIFGTLGPYSSAQVEGTASMSFDFAAGTLSGSMHPKVNDDWDGIFMDFGQYDFTQTVYSSGSTTFSGKFIVPGLPNADSSFDGRFNGPQAAEVMARFVAPYVFEGSEGTISGVWTGKKN